MKRSIAPIATRVEDSLLISCARVALSDETQSRLQDLLRQPIDWQAVLNRAWWHRIRPLVYRHLSQQPQGVVPAACLQVLQEQVGELETRNQRLVQMQRGLGELFDRESIRMLVFKGPTLAVEAYGDLRLRECGDLDLLIAAEDFPRVRQTLISSGFDCLWDDATSSRRRQLFACEFRREGIEIDVHWDLAPAWHNYHVDFENLWSAGEALWDETNLVRKLRPEDSVEVLSVHGTRHWWDRIRWICDLAELVKSGKITDWNRVVQRASDTRCERSVWLGLRLARDLLDARLPPAIEQHIAPLLAVERLTGQVVEWLQNAEGAAASRTIADRFLYRMRLYPRWRDGMLQMANYMRAWPARSLRWNP